MKEFIMSLDWKTIGGTVLVGLSTIGSVIVWFRKNIGDVRLLKQDAKSIAVEQMSSKALISSNKALITELGNFRRDVIELGKTIKRLEKEVIELKKHE